MSDARAAHPRQRSPSSTAATAGPSCRPPSLSRASSNSLHNRRAQRTVSPHTLGVIITVPEPTTQENRRS